jgi:hypothetical protein
MVQRVRPRESPDRDAKDDPVVDALSRAISELREMKKPTFADLGDEVDDVLRRYVAETTSPTPTKSRRGRRD